MQYEATTPAEYIENLEPDWRKEKLMQIREMIKKHGPGLSEGIEYKMLSFGGNKSNVFHLNAQRLYVSLYVGNIDKVENGKELLKDFDTGKGCIRVKKRTVLSESRLEEFIRKTIDYWRNGGDTGC